MILGLHGNSVPFKLARWRFSFIQNLARVEPLVVIGRNPPPPALTTQAYSTTPFRIRHLTRDF